MEISPALVREIIEIIGPYMQTSAERQSFLSLAFGPQSPLLIELDFSGKTEAFIVNLVTHLVNYGDFELGKPALWAFDPTCKKQTRN